MINKEADLIWRPADDESYDDDEECFDYFLPRFKERVGRTVTRLVSLKQSSRLGFQSSHGNDVSSEHDDYWHEILHDEHRSRQEVPETLTRPNILADSIFEVNNIELECIYDNSAEPRTGDDDFRPLLGEYHPVPHGVNYGAVSLQ